MGDEDELRAVRERADEAHEALHVGVVERRVDLVEDAERRRLDEVDREQEGRCRERLLAARELGEADGPLAARPGRDGDRRLERVVAVERHVGLGVAAEEVGEDGPEGVADERERRVEPLARGPVDLVDSVEQRPLGTLDIGALGLEERQALVLGVVALKGEGVDGAERADLLAQAWHVGPYGLGLEPAAFGEADEPTLGVGERRAVVVGEALLGRLLARGDLGEAQVGGRPGGEGGFASGPDGAESGLGVRDAGAGVEDVRLGVSSGRLERVGLRPLGVEATGEVGFAARGEVEGGRQTCVFVGPRRVAAFECCRTSGETVAVGSECRDGSRRPRLGEAGVAPRGLGRPAMGFGGVECAPGDVAVVVGDVGRRRRIRRGGVEHVGGREGRNLGCHLGEARVEAGPLAGEGGRLGVAAGDGRPGGIEGGSGGVAARLGLRAVGLGKGDGCARLGRARERGVERIRRRGERVGGSRLPLAQPDARCAAVRPVGAAVDGALRTRPRPVAGDEAGDGVLAREAPGVCKRVHDEHVGEQGADERVEARVGGSGEAECGRGAVRRRRALGGRGDAVEDEERRPARVGVAEGREGRVGLGVGRDDDGVGVEAERRREGGPVGVVAPDRLGDGHERQHVA